MRRVAPPFNATGPVVIPREGSSAAAAAAIPAAAIAPCIKPGIEAVERATVETAEIDAAKIEIGKVSATVTEAIAVGVHIRPAILAPHGAGELVGERPQLLDQQDRAPSRHDQRRDLGRVAVEILWNCPRVLHRSLDADFFFIAGWRAFVTVARNNPEQSDTASFGEPAPGQCRADVIPHETEQRVAVFAQRPPDDVFHQAVWLGGPYDLD